MKTYTLIYTFNRLWFTACIIGILILNSGCNESLIPKQPKQEVKTKLKKRKLNNPPGYKTFRFQHVYMSRCPVFSSVKHYRYVSKHTNPENCNWAPRWKQ